MLRTQIYLPRDLRKKIDEERQMNGESLSNFLRKSAEDRLNRKKKEWVRLKKLATEFTSGVKKSGWEGMSTAGIIKWQKEIRKDRRILK